MNIVAWLVVFFPIGLILMWSKSNWQPLTKRIVTTVFLVPTVLMTVCSIIYSTTPAGIAAEKAQAVADAKQAKQEATNATPAPAQVPTDADSDTSTDASASSSTEADKELAPALPDPDAPHTMPDPNAYPENGPGQALALFLNGWKQKNWRQMAQQLQSGSSNNSTDELHDSFYLKELHGAALGEMRWTPGVYADIETTIYYLPISYSPTAPRPKLQKFSGVVHLVYDTDVNGQQPTDRLPQWTINPTQFQRATGI